MSQPPVDDGFQDRIQRILNEKKKEDLRQQYGMSFEGHSEEMSPQAEGEWLDYITEFEKQFESTKQVSVREKLGNLEVKPLAEIPDSELAAELDQILERLYRNNIVIDFLHEQDDREMYRFITEELLDEMTDDIRIPGMISHFIYEEFHPNDEDDITQAIDEFLYALFKEELKDPDSMFYFRLSKENMNDADEVHLSLEEFKALVSDFYEAYPILTEHSFDLKNILAENDNATAEAHIEWQGISKNEKATVRHEGHSKFKLTRSIYGGWDIIQANIPGWQFRKKKG
jgi:hypothetical protein